MFTVFAVSCNVGTNDMPKKIRVRRAIEANWLMSFWHSGINWDLHIWTNTRGFTKTLISQTSIQVTLVNPNDNNT